MEGTELAKVQELSASLRIGTGGVQITTFSDVVQAAHLIHDAGWAPKGMNPAQCVVAAMHGLEVGLPICFSIQNLAVINGRPSIFGDAVMALIQASGKLEDWDEGLYEDTKDPKMKESPDRWGYFCEMTRRDGNGKPKVKRGTFTIADAKRAGLWGKQGPWSSYPRRMLQVRARGFVARDLFGDVLRGLWFREEAEDIPDAQFTAEPVGKFKVEPKAEPPQDWKNVAPERPASMDPKPGRGPGLRADYLPDLPLAPTEGAIPRDAPLSSSEPQWPAVNQTPEPAPQRKRRRDYGTTRGPRGPREPMTVAEQLQEAAEAPARDAGATEPEEPFEGK